MKYLQKLWFRILISLLAGGMASEIIFISSGDPTRPRSVNDPNYSLFYALIFYVILTVIVNKFGNKKTL